jgi:hypothetical protein
MPEHVKFGLEGEMDGGEFDQERNCFLKDLFWEIELNGIKGRYPRAARCIQIIRFEDNGKM